MITNYNNNNNDNNNNKRERKKIDDVKACKLQYSAVIGCENGGIIEE